MIKEIYIATERKSPQERKEEVEVHSGLGICGDRYYGKEDHPGRNVSFIEIEKIDWFREKFDQVIHSNRIRRNVITEGVYLNSLVGKTFKIGNVLFYGVELCEPCSKLGDSLSNSVISTKEVVKAFVGKAGLRANILSSGAIATGMLFEIENA